MIVAVRVPNWLGDAVMALPAIRGVERGAAEHGDEVVLIARTPLAPVFAGSRCVAVDRRTETDSLRSLGPSRILLLTHSFSTAWAAWRAGIRERWGEARHLRGPLLTRILPAADHVLHQVDEYARIAQEAGYAVSPEAPRLEPRARARRADLPAGPYTVLAPGARYGAAKRWPRFAELARALADAGRDVVVLGARGEGMRGDDTTPGTSAASTPRSIHDLTGRTTLEEALAIVAHADAVVSNDSGLAHAAAALGRRTVVVFGPTEPERTAPRAGAGIVTIIRGRAECAPCLLRTCPIDHRCLGDVPISAALSALTS